MLAMQVPYHSKSTTHQTDLDFNIEGHSASDVMVRLDSPYMVPY